MRFLIDNALSPIIAEGLRHAGYDVVVLEATRIRLRSLPIEKEE